MWPGNKKNLWLIVARIASKARSVLSCNALLLNFYSLKYLDIGDALVISSSTPVSKIEKRSSSHCLIQMDFHCAVLSIADFRNAGCSQIPERKMRPRLDRIGSAYTARSHHYLKATAFNGARGV